MSKVPYGYCRCGCGQKTTIATRNDSRRPDYRKGDPKKYIRGHFKVPPVEYVVNEETGCWIWQGVPNRGGYCYVTDSGKRRFAHRVFYERHVGPIPEGLEIDHLCRQTRCVNPDHLEAVTRLVNDRRRVDRKLTYELACEMRRLSTELTPKELALRFGVARNTVYKVLGGGTWTKDAA